jgi:site-specific DNA recombinase
MLIEGHSYTSINDKYHFSGVGVVRQILKNPVYIGKIKYGGELYDGHHEPIIDQETFDKAQAIIHEREIKRNFPSLKERHLLTGFLKCSCGARACYHHTYQKKKDGTKRHYEYYECYTRMAHGKMRAAEKCHNKIWRKADLEEVVWNVLEELDYDEVKKSGSKVDTSPLEKKVKKIEKQISKLVELYSLEDIPLDILTTQLSALNSQKETLLEQINLEQNKMARMDEYEVRKSLSSVEKIRKADLKTQRAFLGSLIEEIILLPNHDLKFKWKF